MYIAHEAPLCLMPVVRPLTDYDYCLVHLLEESQDYLNFFEESKLQDRRIIMDCSLFELGEAYHSDRYYEWLLKIDPDEYIVPDVWQDTNKNIESYQEFTSKYDLSKLSGKKIGVLQGKSYEDFEKCYKFLDPITDKIAISFGYDYYWNNFSGELKDVLENLGRQVTEEELVDSNIIEEELKPLSYCLGRITLIEKLLKNKVINTSKPHHLLGCGLPTEFSHYKQSLEEFSFLESLDTSHPIIAGFFNRSYQKDSSLTTKIKTKMVEIFEEKVEPHQYLTILNNIRIFRDNSF
jgi:hypothetical protein